MEIKVLGAYGGESPGMRSSCLLVNNRVALDAGALTSGLSLTDQVKVNAILISHTHLDHIQDLGFIADNVFGKRKEPILIVGLAKSLQIIQKHILNNRIWPDFSRIPTPENPVLAYHPIKIGEETKIEGLSIRAIPVNHSIPSCAFIVSDGKNSFIYTGDSSVTERIWKEAGKINNLRLVVIEVSFPNRMQKLAELTGHLTPKMAEAELEKIDRQGYLARAFHLKPNYLSELKRELAKTKPRIIPLEQGEIIEL